MITPDQAKADLRAALDRVGELIKIRRYTGNGANRPWFDAEVKARVTGFEPDELVGGILQGDRKIIALADDLVAAQLALPVTTNDAVIVRGREMRIIAADDNTRRVAGVLIGIELQVRG